MPGPPAIGPRSTSRVADEIREVFLSATARDLESCRRNVQEALVLISTVVFLQEDWAGSARNVVDLSLQRLEASDAYLGVFGYRYGWVPPEADRSITELECDRALHVWRAVSDPPVFFFLPAVGSPAAAELEASARSVLQDEYRDDPDAQARSQDRQRAFRERLAGSGRFLLRFESIAELRERAIASISNWNKEIFKNAAEQRRSGLVEIPLEALGALGRDDQCSALQRALNALEISTSPGMCVVVHGREQAGQFAFLKFLEEWDGWGMDAGRARVITPPHEEFDESSLRATALTAVAPHRVTAEASFDELARTALAHCAREPLVMIVGRLERLGGLAAFHRDFWVPFRAVLGAQAGPTMPRNRLVLVAASAAPLPVPPPLYAWTGAIDAPSVDYDTLLPLPELRDVTRSHVSQWLRQLGMDATRRQAIAERVTAQDGVPRNVFDRLNAEEFWQTLAS